jgi:nucleotide-binding universal stress UspA family protein
MLKLLVPVDQSARALQAVRHAVFLYRERCASEVVLINVQPPLETSRLEAFYPLAKLRELEEARAQKAIERARAILEDAGVTYSVEVRTGPLVSTIAKCAVQCGCDEIVITAPRTDLFHAALRLVRSGVLDGLLRSARVPVTAVR